MARGMHRAIASTAQWIGDQITDCTGLAAVRVPLERASGPRSKTLGIPGYAQTNSYCCGAVAAVMVARYFHPKMEFGTVYDVVAPVPETGAGSGQVARALRSCGLRVTTRRNLHFGDVCQAIDAGYPLMVVIRNPGADDRHWVVVYGYSRTPDHLYIANNGLPFFTSNRVAKGDFGRLWDPKGNGLICRKSMVPSHLRRKPRKSK
jgi:hypothetical protein